MDGTDDHTQTMDTRVTGRAKVRGDIKGKTREGWEKEWHWLDKGNIGGGCERGVYL